MAFTVRSMSLGALALLSACAMRPAPEAPPRDAHAAGEHDAAAAGAMPMGPPQTVADWAKGAMLFGDLGAYTRKASTSNAGAQRYFDQGMRLLWAFNHDEATRSFAQAAQLDPACGICYWGVALTVGPNYNLPFMVKERAKVAFEAEGLAQRNAAGGSPVEQALIAALARRYPDAQPLDPSNSTPVLKAYSDAMRQVAKRFPDDTDVQVLFAESAMNLNAWKLWSPDGKPAPGTLEIQRTLEAALKRDPQHPGANHYYVHTMEASRTPDKAVPSAERLGAMMPGAGHLVHMPAHIMQRVGRYEDAAEANRRGAAADKAYLAQATPLDYYGMYVAHNWQFLAYSAAMEGRKAESLDAARRTLENSPDEMLAAMPGFDWCVTLTYPVEIRFGMWDEILQEPEPKHEFRARYGGWLAARVMAMSARGQLDDARTVLALLQKTIAETPADYGACFNSAHDVLAVAELIARARLARAEQHPDESIALLQQAVAREDQLNYDEPADWFYPVRHLLGAELLAAGRAREAEAVYRADLKRNRDNGWAYFGLGQALKAQKKDASAAEKKFAAAWANADVTLSASAF